MYRQDHINAKRRIATAAAAILLALTSGCSMQDFGNEMGGMPDVVSTPEAQATAQSQVRSEQLTRMLMAWKQQQRGTQDEEYPIGPEDVLEISVFALERPGQPSVMSRRVNVDGLLNLPFVGDVKVAGMTARQVVQAVTAAYEGTYIRNPQVDVTVTEFRSSPVVVTGAVKQPGVYYLRRRSSTVLEMLSLANGLALEAGNELLIVRGDQNFEAVDATNAPALSEATAPPELAQAAADDASDATTAPQPAATNATTLTPASDTPTEEPKAQSKRKRKSSTKLAPSLPETAQAPEATPDAEAPAGGLYETTPDLNGQMVSINLQHLLDSGDIRLNVPVRGGDVITVPPRRTQYVYVLGYVQRPGALEVREDENLQALQAVARAGGLSGSARAQNSTLITEKDGLRRTLSVDLTSMKRGKAPPAYLKPGDILIVGSSSLAKFAEFIKLSAGASYSPVP